MFYYKDPEDKIHFLDSENFEHLLPKGCVRITDAEVMELRKPTVEQLSAEARARRDTLLSSCDWTILSDAPLTTAKKNAWKAYRQALRDIPSQPGFPNDIQWPSIPE